jgi:hypothetical protein
LVWGKFERSFSRRIWRFLGVVFAGGGWEQWLVVGGQWSVETADFFVGKFRKMHVFWYWMFRIAPLLVGFLLILGELGVKGKDFLLNGIENLHEFHFGSWIFGFRSWGSSMWLISDF